MKKAVRSITTLAVSLSMLVLLSVYGFAAGAPGRINYVAFGDSVSAGVRGGVGVPGSELGSDKGYTDDIAGLLKSAGVLGSFDKSFCISGMTAERLAQETAVLRDASSSGAVLVKSADIATLNIGANDLLQPMYAYISTLKSVADYNPASGREILNQMIENLQGSAGAALQANVETILKNVLAANSTVKVFVMGYYNPLPVVSALMGVDLNEPISYLNTLIEKAIVNVHAEVTGAVISFIPTFDAMASSPGSLVPTDIHPTESGYIVIADEFWKQIKTLADCCQADADVSASKFSMNGMPVSFSAYIIANNNYIKLRDLGMALNGTSKQFSVAWDGSQDMVTLTSGQSYKPVGGELMPIQSGGPVKALISKSVIMLDGKTLNLTVYMIDGNNYIKLRDLAAAVNIDISWEASINTVNIDTSKGYAPAE